MGAHAPGDEEGPLPSPPALRCQRNCIVPTSDRLARYHEEPAPDMLIIMFQAWLLRSQGGARRVFRQADFKVLLPLAESVPGMSQVADEKIPSY